jgi:hypothetical protein
MAENIREARRGRLRFSIILAVFSAAVVHSLLPRAEFGRYDLLARAAITGAAAALTLLVFGVVSRRTAK